MWTLIFWGVVAAVVAGGAAALHHSIYSQGEQAGIAAQVEQDKPIVANLTTERDEARTAEKAREGELADAKSQIENQNAAIKRSENETALAQAMTDQLLAHISSGSKATQDLITKLRADAAKPSTGDANAICTAADAVAVDALRRMRGNP